ncbi:hypothetical protein OCO53_20815, partial [Peribacillus frigoritolerans]|uniref:hypothetical protein n=1 Tax=Peribacillus frigoritolerans TaxID=450367 RepID=UPI0021CFF2F0
RKISHKKHPVNVSLVSNIYGAVQVCLQFLFKNVPIDFRNPLPADCLPGHRTASGCGVLASQLFGRSVANFFNPIRITVKNH